jgi:hypothetical protein
MLEVGKLPSTSFSYPLLLFVKILFSSKSQLDSNLQLLISRTFTTKQQRARNGPT